MLDHSDVAIYVAMGVGALFLIYLIPLVLSHTPRKAFAEELVYQTVSKDGSVETGKLYDVFSRPEHGDGNIELSIVVPSYNETGRITNMLSEAIEHLQKKYSDKWEILIVDDGSQDGTGDYCLKLAREKFKLLPGQMRVVSLVQNRGKGGAVRHGMLHVRGKYALFADADGASKFSDVEKLLASVKRNKHANGTVAIGSRSHMVNTDAVVKRSFLRNFMMYGLHILVYVFGIRYVADTQCGFKLFDLQAIRNIYPFLHTEGWIFDVELLLLAERKGITVDEIPISWHEVSGSKVALTKDSICMTKDLVVTRLAYLFGIYSDSVVC